MPRCSDQYVYVGFYRRKIPRSMAYTITEKEIRFRHPDYNPDRAQKLISSSMSRHLSIRNISSKSMHAFLSNLAHRHTDRQTNECGQTHLPPSLSEVITESTRWLQNKLQITYLSSSLSIYSISFYASTSCTLECLVCYAKCF